VTPPPAHATGADLLAYWSNPNQKQQCSAHTAAIYRSAVRSVLAAQPHGHASDITPAPAPALARHAAANQGILADKTLLQYTSNFRCARRIYLAHLTARDGSHIAISLEGGRSLTVTIPGPLTDADHRRVLAALAERLAPAPETGQGSEGPGEQAGTAP
jgi:hypothetical protein